MTDAATPDRYDVAVIGAGPGGTAAALRAAELGARVVVLEAGRTGGTCVNTGCVPTRVLAATARLARQVRTAAGWGIGVPAETLDWDATVARVHATVDRVRDLKAEPARFAAAGIDLIQEGRARFADPSTLVLDSGRRVEAESIIIAVGGHSRPLPIPGAELATVPEHVLDLPALPRRTVVIGSGNTGSQLVTILSALGSRVTLLDLAPRILPPSDADISVAVRDAFARQGAEVRTGIDGVDRIERDGAELVLHWRDGGEARSTAADAVIMATGWPADVADLGLENAELEPVRSSIPADRYFRTAVPHIYAIGDAIGRDMLVQAAQFEGEAAAENAVLDAHRTPRHLLPAGGFTDPDYAGVGLTEAEARERDPECVVATIPYSQLDRAVLDGRETGFLKLIADRRRELILGAHAVGENAVEVVQSVTTAMSAGTDVTTLAGVRFAYPTYSAIIGMAARALLGSATAPAELHQAAGRASIRALCALLSHRWGPARALLSHRWGPAPALLGHRGGARTTVAGCPAGGSMADRRAMPFPTLGDLADAGEAPTPRLGRGRRFAQIVGIARRNGLLPLRRLDFTRNPATASVRAAQADGLRRGLEEAGGAFVKMGQIFSTRNDLLPEEWTDALAHLQRNVAPAPWEATRALLERELGAPLESVFRELDPDPIAAASIAQVHRGVLLTGEIVAVKVQRPGIEPEVRRDIDIALRITRMLVRGSGIARDLGMDRIAVQYGEDLARQLNFRREAVNLTALRATMLRGPRADEVRLPELYESLSTRRVLVMELLDGETIGRVVAARGTDDPEVDRAMRAVLRSFVRQVVFDGVYHADLHPGNVMLLADGRPALVDFGSVGRLDRRLRETAQELVVSYLQGDTQQVADGLLSLVELRPGADERRFRQELGAFIVYELGPGSRIDVRTADALVEILARYGISVPPDLVAAGRGFGILDGTLRTTVPRFDVLAEARDLAREQVADQLTPDALRRLLSTELLGLLPAVRRLPRRADRISRDLEEGRLSVNIRLLADPRDRRLLSGLTRQLGLVAVALVAGVLSVLQLTTPLTDVPRAVSPVVLGAVLGVVAVLALVGAAVDAIRIRRR